MRGGRLDSTEPFLDCRNLATLKDRPRRTQSGCEVINDLT